MTEKQRRTVQPARPTDLPASFPPPPPSGTKCSSFGRTEIARLTAEVDALYLLLVDMPHLKKLADEALLALGGE